MVDFFYRLFNPASSPHTDVILGGVYPLQTIGRDYLLSASGCVTIGFEVEFPESGLLTRADFEGPREEGMDMMGVLAGAIEKLPWETMFIHQDIFYEDIPQRGEAMSWQETAHMRDRLTSRAYRKRSFFMLSFLRPLLDDRTVFEARLQPLREAGKELMLACSEFLVSFHQMQEADWRQYLSLALSLPDGLAASSLDFKRGEYGDNFIEGYRVMGDRNINSLDPVHPLYPHCPLEQEYAAPLGSHVDAARILSNFILPIPRDRALESASSYEKYIGIFSRLSLSDDRRDVARYYISRIESGEEVSCLHLFTAFYVYPKRERERVHGEILDSFSRMGIRPERLPAAESEYMFFSSLAGGAYRLSEEDLTLTLSTIRESVCFSQFTSPVHADLSGVEFRDRDGRAVLVDDIVRPMRDSLISNFNALVIGPSGTGKSFFENSRMLSMLSRGCFLFVVDIGGSYRMLSRAFKEESIYIDFDPEKPLVGFNPFSLGRLGQDDPQLMERIDELLLLVAAAWDPDSEMRIYEDVNRRTELRNLLKDFYLSRIRGKCSRQVSFDDFYHYVERYKRNLRSRNSRLDLDSFLSVMEKFTQGGEMHSLFSGEGDLREQLSYKRMVIFDVERIRQRKEWYDIAVFVIMMLSQHVVMQHPAWHKRIILDEAWRFLEQSALGEYVKLLYKTLRKHGAGIEIVVQDAFDVTSSRFADAILHNSDSLYLLPFEGHEQALRDAAPRLNLSPRELNLALSAKKASHSVFMRQGTHSRLLQLRPTAEEYFLFTTTRSETLQRDILLDYTHGDVRAAQRIFRQYSDEKNNVYADAFAAACSECSDSGLGSGTADTAGSDDPLHGAPGGADCLPLA